jgi:hypothetical protein
VRSRLASYCEQREKENSGKARFRSLRTGHRRHPMTIRGGGHPKQTMVLTPVSRMGPPPRRFAADAHGCIMVRFVVDLPDTRLRREVLVPDSELPLGPVIPTTTSVPPCSGLSRRGLERWNVRSAHTATAGLDSPPCARRPPRLVGRGEETGFQVEQRNWGMKKGEGRARRSLALRPAHSRCHQFVTRIPKAWSTSSDLYEAPRVKSFFCGQHLPTPLPRSRELMSAFMATAAPSAWPR